MAAPVPVTPKVGAAVVASPAGVLELDTHSSLKDDPSKSSPPPVSRIPKRHVSPTTSTLEVPTAPILPAPSAVIAPSSEFPVAPIIALPEIHQ
ncbi:hypothetical protein Tco_1039090 [Tanacetum coccineum]